MMYLLFFIFLLSSLSFTAQGNLQFNQVLRINNIAQTVPVNKVWKIESYMQSQTSLSDGTEISTCNLIDRHHPFLINTKPYFIINGSPGHGSSGTYMAVGNHSLTILLWQNTNQRIRSSRMAIELPSWSCNSGRCAVAASCVIRSKLPCWI